MMLTSILTAATIVVIMISQTLMLRIYSALVRLGNSRKSLNPYSIINEPSLTAYPAVRLIMKGSIMKRSTMAYIVTAIWIVLTLLSIGAGSDKIYYSSVMMHISLCTGHILEQIEEQA
jgi:hypothetical protein